MHLELNNFINIPYITLHFWKFGLSFRPNALENISQSLYAVIFKSSHFHRNLNFWLKAIKNNFQTFYCFVRAKKILSRKAFVFIKINLVKAYHLLFLLSFFSHFPFLTSIFSHFLFLTSFFSHFHITFSLSLSLLSFQTALVIFDEIIIF